MSELGKKSYQDSIANFHPAFLREAINMAFMTVPARSDFCLSAFGTSDLKVFHEILGGLVKPLAVLVARLWKYYKEKGITLIE